MNATEALEYSIELWTWLAENPDKRKSDNPIVKENDWIFDCPLCEFAFPCCQECPMYGSWETKSGFSNRCEPYSAQCETFYKKYRFSTDRQKRSFYASKLVDSFKKKLEELNERNRST